MEDEKEQPAPSVDLEAELTRWFGALLRTVGPKVPTDVYNDLMNARDNLNSILHAAGAAK
jgi:hypothetical protein